MKYVIIISVVLVLFVAYRLYKSYIEFNRLSKTIDIRLLKAKNSRDLGPIWVDIVKLHDLAITKKQKISIEKLVSKIDDINSFYYGRENHD